ncbi:MAG: HD domain-containing protein [Clostridia bacterium]|nr:HD domain-containing protein [Clostridia bacterium]
MKILLLGDNEKGKEKIISNLLELGYDHNSIVTLSENFKDDVKTIYSSVFLDYLNVNLEVLTFISSFRQFNRISPVFMVINRSDNYDFKIDLLEIGVTDFLERPIDKNLFQATIKNIQKYRHKCSDKVNDSNLLQSRVGVLTEDIGKRDIETLRIISKLAEFRNPETGFHIERVAKYSKILARQSGFNSEFQELIYRAAPLHDIGKVGIPDYVLLKTGKLTDDEWEIMKTHARIGFNILANTEHKILQAGATISMTHHEKYNGTGYPNKLKQETIPIIGRIVSVADVFDALTSSRSYKEAWSFEKAMEEIKLQSGEHFDPVLAECFIKASDEIKKVYLELREQ